MIYDTHCHLNIVRETSLGKYDCKPSTNDDVKSIIQRAKESNISYLMQAGCYLNEIEREIEICEKFSDKDITIVCGLANHPENVKETGVVSVDEIVKIANQSKYIKAIGETGLDTHRPENYEFLEQQRKSFENHIFAGIQLNLPIIVHAYGEDAIKRSIDMVESIFKNTHFKFVFHCYDGTYEQAKKIVDCGGIISFSGTITFKKKTIAREILSNIPLDNIVIETDSPFLAPEPFRGKENEPSLIKYTAQYASEYLGLDYEEFCNKTKENGLKLFNQQ